MKPNNLIFCFSPITNLAEDCQKAGIERRGAAVVPLTGAAAITNYDQDFQILNAFALSAESEFIEIFDRVDAAWWTWLGEDPDDKARQYFSYIYHITRTPIEHWRLTIERVVGQVQPETVYIYSTLESVQTKISDRRSLLEWARLQLVTECIPERVPIVHIVASPPASRIRPRLSRDRVIDGLSFWRHRIRGLLSRTCRRPRQAQPSASAKVVVIGQVPKSGRLLAHLESSGIKFLLMEVSDLLDHPVGDGTLLSNPVYIPTPSFSVDTAFALVLAQLLEDVHADSEALRLFAASSWQLLLTNMEYDPRVRMLLDLAADNEKRVATYPEGTQPANGPAVSRFYRNWFHDSPRLTRIAVNSWEADQYKSHFKAQEVLVGGSLASKIKRESNAMKVNEWLIRLGMHAGWNNRRLALVNLDFLGDLGLGRSGQPDPLSELSNLHELIVGLVENKWAVFVTCKSNYHFRELRQKYRLLPVFFFASVSWHVLAKVCDIVIQRDSSIGPEALELGYSVLIWNISGLPLMSEDLISRLNGGTAVVTSLTDLPRALTDSSFSRNGRVGYVSESSDSCFARFEQWLDSALT